MDLEGENFVLGVAFLDGSMLGFENFKATKNSEETAEILGSQLLVLGLSENLTWSKFDFDLPKK